MRTRTTSESRPRSDGRTDDVRCRIGRVSNEDFEDQASDFTAYLRAGIRKDLLSPVATMAALQLEGYGGVRGGEIDGGVGGLFTIPFIWLGSGVED